MSSIQLVKMDSQNLQCEREKIWVSSIIHMQKAEKCAITRQIPLLKPEK